MKFKPGLWLYNVALAVPDEWINALFGGARDETMSSRMGRAIVQKRKGFGGWLGRTLCRGLDLIQKDHCIKCYMEETKGDPHRPEPLDDQPGD